jgi:hypothetical protein
MKKLVLVVFVPMATAAFAQQKDTTVILQPDRVEIVSDDSSLSVKVDNKDKTFEASLFNEDATLEVEKHRLDFGSPFQQRKKWEMQPYTLIPINELSAGFLIPGGSTNKFGQSVFSSQEIGINFLTLQYRPWRDHRYFSVGTGFQWTSFAGKDFWYAMDGDRLIKTSVPEGASSPGAHLDFTGLRFPLSYGFNVSSNNSLELTAGINYWLQAKAENLLNGKNYEGFLLNNYRPVTVDFRLSWLMYGSVGLYVKYMPPLWFKPGQGPQNHTVSLGGIIRL